jgi:2-hydroxychromene-2-carboxylate isomerase
MLSILTTVLGSEEEAKSVLERTKSEEVKKVLGSNTEMAFADGAFGLPWFVATNGKGVTQGYWGVDHISLMCDHLGIGRPDGKERALL